MEKPRRRKREVGKEKLEKSRENRRRGAVESGEFAVPAVAGGEERPRTAPRPGGSEIPEAVGGANQPEGLSKHSGAVHSRDGIHRHSGKRYADWSDVNQTTQEATMEMIAFDSHKRYTLASVERPDWKLLREERIERAGVNSVHEV